MTGNPPAGAGGAGAAGFGEPVEWSQPTRVPSVVTAAPGADVCAHRYVTHRQAGVDITVRLCRLYGCRAIDWTDLVDQAARLRGEARWVPDAARDLPAGVWSAALDVAGDGLGRAGQVALAQVLAGLRHGGWLADGPGVEGPGRADGPLPAGDQ